jgi:hypothetical protein
MNHAELCYLVKTIPQVDGPKFQPGDKVGVLETASYHCGSVGKVFKVDDPKLAWPYMVAFDKAGRDGDEAFAEGVPGGLWPFSADELEPCE